MQAKDTKKCKERLCLRKKYRKQGFKPTGICKKTQGNNKKQPAASMAM